MQYGKIEVEVWKVIEDFTDYEVSIFGNIRRCKRGLNKFSNKRFIGKKLKLQKGSYGYFYILLHKNKKQFYKKIHRLVALTFIPNPEGKPEVNHIDGNKSNNSIGNLEWVTHKENMRHAWEIGLMEGVREVVKEIGKKQFGENQGQHKLTEKEVIEIIKLCKEGNLLQKEIADKYKVSMGCISGVKYNTSWKYLKR